jgi:hypothetical protein
MSRGLPRSRTPPRTRIPRDCHCQIAQEFKNLSPLSLLEDYPHFTLQALAAGDLRGLPFEYSKSRRFL